MRTIGLFMMFLLLCACASSTPPKSQSEALTEALTQVADEGVDIEKAPILLIEIHSHGALADTLGAAKKAQELRSLLEKLATQENGVLVVFGSSSRSLDTATVKGALSEPLPQAGTWLVFVGRPEQKQTMEELVKPSGVKYGFVSVYK